jgi:hypothetical protein
MNKSLKTWYLFQWENDRTNNWSRYLVEECPKWDVEQICVRNSSDYNLDTSDTPDTNELSLSTTRLKTFLIEYYEEALPINYHYFFKRIQVQTIIFLVPVCEIDEEVMRIDTALKHVTRERWLEDNDSVTEIIFKNSSGKHIRTIKMLNDDKRNI